MQHDKKYEKFYKQAEEVLAHQKAKDESWGERYKEIFLAPTTLTDKDLKKLDALIKDKEVENYTLAEKCFILTLCCGLRFREIVNLKRHNFIIIDGNYYIYIDRVIPFDLKLHTMMVGSIDENNDVYVLGDGKEPIDPKVISDEVYNMFKETGTLHENTLISLATTLLRAEEMGKSGVENDLVEYLLRKSFATGLYSEGCSDEKVAYFLGI
jgi:integrase